jgi:hypothetical protein
VQAHLAAVVVVPAREQAAVAALLVLQVWSVSQVYRLPFQCSTLSFVQPSAGK